jgi:hydrogenase expression/formation protein HypE
MEHGAGRGLAELFNRIIRPALLPGHTAVFEDAAVFATQGQRIAFTTDSFVVQPLRFPGGDIGKLAACGTINDLAMMGALPRYLSISLILEEGLDTPLLTELLTSLRIVCKSCGVEIACGDTKVVDKGHGSGVYITTSGIGTVPPGIELSAANAKVGDMVIVSGQIGAHGVAVLAARNQLSLGAEVVSDCAPLVQPAQALLAAAPSCRVMRDATRGGCAAVLNEIATDSQVTLRLESGKIPVSQPVSGACAYLGMEPLHLANEGTFIAIVPSSEVDAALTALRHYPSCSAACAIGTAIPRARFPVIADTDLGSTRPIEVPFGALLPRIC